MIDPIKKWQADFEKDPLQAVDNLLIGNIYMGELHGNEVSEILFRLFHTKSTADQESLDTVMQDWFTKYWRNLPLSISTSKDRCFVMSFRSVSCIKGDRELQ